MCSSEQAYIIEEIELKGKQFVCTQEYLLDENQGSTIKNRQSFH